MTVPRTMRMTASRLGRLVADADTDAVRAAVADAPRLLAGTVERGGDDGWTPLHLAVAQGREDVVRVLVDAGADLGARTGSGRTPLHVAVEHAPHLVGVLTGLGAAVDAPAAAYLDDADRLAAELDGGAPLRDPAGGWDLLTVAAAGGAARAVRLLLDRGADPDGGALTAAAGACRPDLVRVLLDAGATVGRRDPDTGRTALHEAVAAGPGGDAPEVVRLLVAAGADVNATTSDGASALDISRVAAARHRRDAGQAGALDALVDLLVASGARD
ncbi:ankyrin repeat domain-containing protein [Geodermatophilus normandii]|uniref:Ankyrin repeat domain-containing protein n=1 Tax=Geodermatophilus normandii TaxID=1137989 RepID=A0A6P0GE32_9ACTN|nr:ankyrin repeat domain-containing protein [Geodermatophilus normandii]NEM05159.1 ankyrin repeat domain-containing protein [Geodermatophilus normandii]